MPTPSAFFSIREANFTVRGHNDKPAKDVRDWVLYLQDEVFYESFETLGGRVKGKKAVKRIDLKEIARLEGDGYDEKTTGLFLKHLGWPELLDKIHALELTAVGFCAWVKGEVDGAQAAGKGAGHGPRMASDPEVTQLVMAMRGLAPGLSPAGLKERLVQLVADARKLDEAVAVLTKAETEHGRDGKDNDQYILLRTRTRKDASAANVELLNT